MLTSAVLMSYNVPNSKFNSNGPLFKFQNIKTCTIMVGWHGNQANTVRKAIFPYFSSFNSPCLIYVLMFIYIKCYPHPKL